MKYLKNIRIVVSVIFFCTISVIYLDITNSLPLTISQTFTSFQILPSMLKVIYYTSAASIGIIVVLFLTLSIGRIYCSSICPLGTYQDFVIRLSRRNRKRRWFHYLQQHYWLHYSLLGCIIIALFFGSVALLNLLEPFSNFGRIIHTLVAPIIILINNFFAFILGSFNIYLLYNIPNSIVPVSIFVTVILFFVTVTYLSFYHGRLFCNSLCPAGALLGLLTRIALFKLVINESSCTHCKLCEKVCKAKCIDSNLQKLDFSACIGCFNCIDACHTDGVVYEYRWKKHETVVKEVPVFESRRNFLHATSLPIFSAIIPINDSLVSTQNAFDQAKKHPISPPGSISISHFSSSCTACQLCVASCPTKVLQPAFFDYGISGFLQPKMDYNRSYCNYDCTICTNICPAGAILPLQKEDKKLTQIGKTVFYKEDCIVITKKKDCGACSEHCPTKAVNMVPYQGLFLPELKNSICIGCGACEHACPTTPRKAIYIESNAIHARAEKPTVKKPTIENKPLEEFPF